ncbi:MAG: AraC family ligand binding domain-containing protein [Spirochaetota bacterium]
MNNANWLENGSVFINGEKLNNTSSIQWEKHPKFEGVFIKNLFTGSDSNNNLSAMIVKIEPNHEIGNHIHEGKAELHEIIDGDGEAMVDNTTLNYYPGVISLIPGNILHNIKAGKKGMILLAKFTPPLN